MNVWVLRVDVLRCETPAPLHQRDYNWGVEAVRTLIASDLATAWRGRLP